MTQLNPFYYVQYIVSQFLEPSHPYYQPVVFGLTAILFWYATKFFITQICRILGLYHINHYARWPRLPWRMLWKTGMAVCNWWQEVFTFGKRSTAGFSSMLSTLSLMYRQGMIPLGRAYALGFGLTMPVGIKPKRHMMVIAMTGAGKTVYLTLLISGWKSSVFQIDPKGSVTRALKRSSKKEWQVIAPYDTDIHNGSFNVFSEIKEVQKRIGKDIAVSIVEKICEALIVTSSNEHNPFFTSSARALYSSAILHVLSRMPEDKHNLPHVYQLVCRGYWERNENTEIAFDLFLDDMLKNHSFDGVIASRAAAIAGAGKVTRGNILATARDQTKWIGLPEMKPILSSSSFLCSDLKRREDLVVSFVAPVGAIRGHLSGFARLLTNMIAYSFEFTPGGKRNPCLIAVDEFQAQGYNEYLEQATPLLRGYGAIFLGLTQDIEGMQKAYSSSWEGFLGNADSVIWMATNHQQSLEYLSRVLGKKTRSQKIQGTSRRMENERDVMTPEQLSRFLNPANENIIVTRAGARPLKLKLLKYFVDLPVSIYEPASDHDETIFRKIYMDIFGGYKTHMKIV